ncbi:hypothetical protein SAMN05216350_104318 [Polaromonas sp. YR568]|uniref:hypothetical protein n=1 Tax=Polaromonas sp. YR568 TaxID=1855301 RepID=UPI0008DF3AA2|nr:hypothetical protein [Polaromonas sp. YR568]SFU74590.1 hypothetical protein SAMN05216350_104318 [Polaromonas sp. YR568]
MGLSFAIVWIGFLLVVAFFLLMVIVKSLKWGFSTEAGQSKTAGRRFAALLLALLAAGPFVYPFARDGYRDALCRSEPRIQVFVSPENWVPTSKNTPKVHSSQRIGETMRVVIAPGLAEDHSQNARGFGVYEQSYTFLDATSGQKLATTTTFHSRFGELIPLGYAAAVECDISNTLPLRFQYMAKSR